MSTIKLYRHPLSGHAHRVELFLSLLGLDAEIITVDLMQGEHKKPEFLAKNPAGQVPVLEDGEIVLSDSNAILVYLAQKYDRSAKWLPEDPVAAAKVQAYLSNAAGPLAYGPAAARLITLFGAQLDAEKTQEIAKQVLTRLEQTLSQQAWLVGEQPTLAEVSHYAYLVRAPEGNVDLSPYPNVRDWLNRIEQLDGFVAMTASKVGLAA